MLHATAGTRFLLTSLNLFSIDTSGNSRDRTLKTFDYEILLTAVAYNGIKFYIKGVSIFRKTVEESTSEI
jgi:hypothetical protein